VAGQALGAQGCSDWGAGCGCLVLAGSPLIYPIGFELDELAVFSRDDGDLSAVRLSGVGSLWGEEKSPFTSGKAWGNSRRKYGIP
jgi:hypothetical protein